MHKDFDVLGFLRIPNGLFIAGGGDYDKIWIRDNAYIALSLLESGRIADAVTIYQQMCIMLATYEPILRLQQYPRDDTELLPPRFTRSGDRVPGHWGNKQHDAIGVFLFGAAKLYAADQAYLRPAQQRLCQLLVDYLERCKYWDDPDNGMWEEDYRTVRASSLAACVAGIPAVGDFCTYNPDHLAQARANLERLLPHESNEHRVDLSLLSLVWPYGNKNAGIVAQIEHELLRTQGVARFPGDVYESVDGHEPEWTMGIPWLGLAHLTLGNVSKAREYLDHAERLYTPLGLPESYVAVDTPCPHMPLAWAHALTMALRSRLTDLD